MTAALFDAHCHLDLPAFDADRDAVWQRAVDAGVRFAVVPAVHPQRWEHTLAAALAGARGVALGVHPHALPSLSRDALDDALARLAGTVTAHRDRVVAIGECGLDVTTAVPMDQQLSALAAHAAVARALDLPLVLHVVGAHPEALALLSSVPLPSRPGLVHAYSGGASRVRAWTDLGFHLSFGGSVTRPVAKRPAESARATPAHRLLVETDAPDQLPHGVDRPSRRCEPADLARVVDALAALRETTPDQLAALTTANASALFAMPTDHPIV